MKGLSVIIVTVNSNFAISVTKNDGTISKKKKSVLLSFQNSNECNREPSCTLHDMKSNLPSFLQFQFTYYQAMSALLQLP